MSEFTEKSADVLDSIRQVEAQIRRRLAVAREEADAQIASARKRAQEIVGEAELEGQQMGEAERRVILQETDEEMAFILAHVEERARELRHLGQDQMEAAVIRVVLIVTGQRSEKEAP